MHSEALKIVEDKLTAIGLKDKLGEPCIGLECIGALARFAPEPLAELEHKLLSGFISPEQYAIEMGALIDELSIWVQRAKTEKKLASLRADQVELGIIKKPS